MQIIFKTVSNALVLIQKSGKTLDNPAKKQYLCSRFENHTPMTQEQREALKHAIKNNFFMPNPSRLAGVIGLSGKMIFSRLLNGEIKSTAFNRLWEQIKDAFNTSEQVMLDIPELWDLSERMANVLKREQFVPLVKHTHMDNLPADLRKPLDELYNKDYMLYSYALALFYAKASGCDPNEMKGCLAIIEAIQQADAILWKQYPEEFSAHKVSQDMITLAQELSSAGWFNLMESLGTIICYYTHPLYLEQRIESDFRSMPFGENSFWTECGADDTHTTLWLLEQYEQDSGIYNVLQIQADKTEKVKESQCTFQRWGFFSHADVMRCAVPQGGKMLRSAYYAFKYKQEEGILYTELQRDNSSRNPLILPEAMSKTDEQSAWAGWIQENEDQIYDIFCKKIFAGFGFEECGMEVTDVSQSRHALFLHVRHEESGGKHLYKLDISRYPSLRHITPWGEVAILKSRTDGELYACWLSTGIHIRLSQGMTDEVYSSE